MAKNMSYEEIMEKMEHQKIMTVSDVSDIPYGKKISLSNGAIINSYDKGTYNIQGKCVDKVKEILENTSIANRKIFVVYGHDEIARTQLEAMLRRWDLEPIILDQQASGGQTIIEKLEEYTDDVSYAIVLATPDDEGKAKEEEMYKYRVRQNVVLELGLFLAKLGRDKVAVLLKECTNFERPSDIQGLVYIPFQNKVDEVSVSLIRELSRQGINIDSSRI